MPARFRRERILIVGCGDIGLRVLRLLPSSVSRLALSSSPARGPELRAHGARVLLGDLDQAQTLSRLSGVATRVLHLAPPAVDAAAPQDDRSRALVHALGRRSAARSWVYGSTSGVYGDCGGDWVSEARPLNPSTARAKRRVDAEQVLRASGRRAGVRVTVLRIPGIYAPDRAGGTPRERLMRGLPVLREADDVFTNHIHANDLARACVLALWRGLPQRVINVSDDTQLRMGEYMRLAARLYALPEPQQVSRAEAAKSLTPMALSFMGESRRLLNQRMKAELRLRLSHPTVVTGLLSSGPAAR